MNVCSLPHCGEPGFGQYYDERAGETRTLCMWHYYLISGTTEEGERDQ